ncbi:MAG: DUF445 domain-containing protein [Candidatus Rokuibacteriota bacterium]
MRPQRRLALGVLVAAALIAIGAYPFRDGFWGGLVLAMAEAGVVGGLADWFAVTALFRHPLGIPIPHTALIPSNWELMAARVGSMVGNRVLTKEYVSEEIGRIDVAELLAQGAARVSRRDLETATLTAVQWVADLVTPATSGELLARLRRALMDQPVAPALAAALGVARRHGWDQHAVQGLLTVLADAMDRPEFRATVGELIDDLLARYRARLGKYPRLFVGLASALGIIDRERLVAALHAGLKQVAADPEHPLRERWGEVVADLERRLATDAVLAAKVEEAKRQLLETPAIAQLFEDAAGALHRALLADLLRDRSQVVEWLADRLERARVTLIEDAELRVEVDRWIKARVTDLVERHHGRLASFIENGVRALGPEGAVRLIEEHAGDDLQFIRVNGTVVGGLAGGAIYGIHVLLRML